ncbi:transporter [Reticulibacter mediterranei]|uniref:Transporter n=1 Tax=Reticulibacter mediterranei TaxID=2778369 RepID=A0A8J3IYM3_9CHLR|nr:AEC family transporter [Reticulibacter mediterranei]GHP00904.1 transporter [Reticulibacter mediterranei]
MTAFEKTLPILLIFFVGLALKRMKILKREHAPLLSQIILKVALPATIVNSLAGMDLSPHLFLLPVSGLMIVTILLGIAYFVLAPALGLQGRTRGAFLMAFPSLELGSIGYAYMLAFYGGSDGVGQIALLDVGNSFFFFTVVASLARYFGHSTEQFRLHDGFLNFLKNPVSWAYALGLGLNLLHIHNEMFSTLFAALAQALLLLIMLLIAVEFELRLSSFTLPLLAMYFKAALGVIVGLLVSLLFGFTGMTRVAVVLGASLPSSLMTVAFARENELDTPFLASQLSLALPTAIGFSSVLMALMR